MVHPDQRIATLSQIRHHKMARSAHAYVRGRTAKFYAWLEKSGVSLPKGPSVWICGDCHVGNPGPTASAKGRVAVQIRDLDQTVIGNPAHDIVRLSLSLASAGRSADLSGIVTAHMLEAVISGYEDALVADHTKKAHRPHRPRQIQALLGQSVRRRWRHLARERLKDVEPSTPPGRKFWPPTEDERAAVRTLIKGDEVRRVLTRLTDRDDDESIHLVHLAYWVKGCSSLGRLRFAALVGFGKNNASGYCLVDIKERVAPAAPRDPKMPVMDNAARVVAGARALSPNLGQRMFAASLLDKPVIVRELMPQDLKIEIENLKETDALRLAQYLGAVVGRAHGRQMSERAKHAWHKELQRHRPKTLDAPNWLWTSVVDLMGIHEAAYLEHCRRIIASAA